MSEVKIDWASAEVSDSTLVVELRGDPPKGWRGRMEGVLELLNRGGGAWGAINVGKERIAVAGVDAGDADELRHLLESAVQQANADLAPEEHVDDERDDAHADTPDARLAAVFRGFAGGAQDGGG